MANGHEPGGVVDEPPVDGWGSDAPGDNAPEVPTNEVFDSGHPIGGGVPAPLEGQSGDAEGD